jgi:hypothetical protein
MRKISKEITRDELNKAMDKFLNKGGKVEVLPTQKVITIQRVHGATVVGAYEDMDAFNDFASNEQLKDVN